MISHNNLAAAYVMGGRATDAIALHERGLNERQSNRGPDHPATRTSRIDLGSAFPAAGRTREAIVFLDPELKISERDLGPVHPDTLASRNNLAVDHAIAGSAADAIALHEETLRLYQSKLGLDDPGRLRSHGNLCDAYLTVGRAADAIRLLQETLKLSASKLSRGDPTWLKARTGLASAYEAVGRWGDAEVLRRMVVDRRKVDATDGPLLAGELADLGLNPLNHEKASEAEPVLRENLAIREKAVPGNWRTFSTMSQLGGALTAQGCYAEAERLVVPGHEGTKARVSQFSVPAPTPARRGGSTRGAAIRALGQIRERQVMERETRSNGSSARPVSTVADWRPVSRVATGSHRRSCSPNHIQEFRKTQGMEAHRQAKGSRCPCSKCWRLYPGNAAERLCRPDRLA